MIGYFTSRRFILDDILGLAYAPTGELLIADLVFVPAEGWLSTSK